MLKFYLEMNEAKIIKFVRKLNNKYSKNDINELEKILNNKELDHTVNYCAVLRMASKNGHYEIVKLLIHDLKIDPSIYDNYACFSGFAWVKRLCWRIYDTFRRF